MTEQRRMTPTWLDVTFAVAALLGWGAFGATGEPGTGAAAGFFTLFTAMRSR